jgi:sugar phosphate isomerase/epimerase
MTAHFFLHVPYPILRTRIDDLIRRGLHPEVVLDACTLDRLDRREAQQLADRLQREGRHTTLHGPFRDLSPGGADPKVRMVTRERFSQTLDLAEIFAPSCVLLHSGYDSWRFFGHESLWLENSVETWAPIVERAKRIGVTIAVENVFEKTPSNILSLLERIRSPHFRHCLDVGHHNAFAETPMDQWIEEMAPYLAEVHLHDNRGKTDDHLAIGAGTVDFPLVFRLLRQYLKTEPIFCLEPGREEYLDATVRAFVQLTGKLGWPTHPGSHSAREREP